MERWWWFDYWKQTHVYQWKIYNFRGEKEDKVQRDDQAAHVRLEGKGGDNATQPRAPKDDTTLCFV